MTPSLTLAGDTIVDVNSVTTTITGTRKDQQPGPGGDIPNPDETLSTKKGICLDYASLTTAMLRSQGVPTKLEVGYSGDAYHAWISVWTKETGWIDNVIRFDGKKWTLIDPTLAANNSKQSVRKYIGDGSNYTLKFVY